MEDEEALRNLYNEKSGVLDEPDDDEVDLPSEAFEIWSQATKDNPGLRKAIEAPPMLSSLPSHTCSILTPAFTPTGVAHLHPHGTITTRCSGLTRKVRQFRVAGAHPSRCGVRRRYSGASSSDRQSRARWHRHPHRAGGAPRHAVRPFLTNQVRAAIQAIYDHPQTTEAVDKLNRQLRTHISDDDLAQLVTTLHRDGRLVVSGVHDTDLIQSRILRTMGLVENRR